jgi:hypothetical protein
VIWTDERYVSQALTAPFRYRTLSLSDRGHVNLRLSFSTLHHRGSTRTVVETNPASVDADCDNRTVLHSAARSRRSYDLAVKRSGALEQEKRRSMNAWVPRLNGPNKAAFASVETTTTS